VIVLQYLGGKLYDVTRYFKTTGKMTLYLLPTFEGEIAPLLKKEPAGGSRLYSRYVQLLIADAGVPLPPDYPERQDIWIVQYLAGRFTDVSNYYKGRHAARALRVVDTLADLRCSVDRRELYPRYDRFDTPGGTPVFFPTPDKDIITQIGGSNVVIALHRIPPNSQLRFDVSWMHDQGDGAWAEAAIRAHGREQVIYREYMKLDAKEKNLLWKEVRVDLRDFVDTEPDLILKCYNDPGKNTVADWLNWRDIVIERNK
jgi:hypothetical protein